MPLHPVTPTRSLTHDVRRNEGEVVRIVVTGSESAGKSTLARQLAKLLEAPLVDEHSRRYAEQVARPLTADDVEPIARGQLHAEDAGIARARSLCHPDAWRRTVVLDTDLVSTVVYARHYYGTCPPWIVDLARTRRADLYLLCLPDLTWEADGVRDRPLHRATIHAHFVEELRALGATTLAVYGQGGERLARALAAVRGWRAAHAEPAARAIVGNL